MKRVLVGVAALGAVLLGVNFYYTQQVKKHLDSAAGVMRSMGGYLEYDDVGITLGGDVEIDRVRIMIPGLDESLSLDRIALRTDGLWGVHRLAMDIRKKRLPAQLGLSFEGMMLPIGGEAYRQTNAFANEASENLLVAGCDERELFDDEDIAAMGFGELVKVDTVSEYRLMNEGQWIELETRATVAGMNEVVMNMDFSLNAKSRDMSAISTALMSARFNEMVLDYHDAGYIARVIDFCAQEMAMDKAEFIAHHIDSWQEVWQEYGLVPGNNFIHGYRQFLEQPKHFRLNIKPTDDFSLVKLAQMTPDMLPYQFRSNLSVNGADMGTLEISAAAQLADDIDFQSISTADRPATTTTRTTRSNSRPRPVSVEQLNDHLNQEVVLHLNSGRTVDGRITQLSEDGLHIHSYQPTGYMTIPVSFSQIREAFVK
jgi:hypothetical protein